MNITPTEGRVAFVQYEPPKVTRGGILLTDDNNPNKNIGIVTNGGTTSFYPGQKIVIGQNMEGVVITSDAKVFLVKAEDIIATVED